MRQRTNSVDSGFWSKVRMSLFCWEWKASTGSHGYGEVRVGGKRSTAHRFSWELHFGPVPGGLCVLHRCDNKRCVNPGHLFLGTHADNVSDKVSKGRHRIGRGIPQAKLSDDNVRSIREALLCGRSQSSVAKEFGVVQSVISAINTGKRWRHVLMLAPVRVAGEKGSP